MIVKGKEEEKECRTRICAMLEYTLQSAAQKKAHYSRFERCALGPTKKKYRHSSLENKEQANRQISLVVGFTLVG